jgi:nitronate monooxygenase
VQVFRTRLTARFGIDHPVVLAPMDLVADARLASAVSAAGGLGLVGGGYGNREWLERQFAAIGSDGVGWGFITWSLARKPELLDLVLEHSPAAIFLSFGDPMPFAGRIHDAGVPLICQVSTLDHARRAIDAGAAVLAAQGGEAGGHGTATRSTFTFVPEVADLVAATAPDTLVLASGGVADGRGLAAALSLGADGVLVGTRFWASHEAVVSRDAQRRALAASGDDTLRTSVYDIVRSADWPEQYDGRLLRNAFLDHWHGREDELRARLDQAKQEFTAAVAAEDYGTANVIVGEAVGMIHEVLPAATILHRMIRDAVAALPPSPAQQPEHSS